MYLTPSPRNQTVSQLVGYIGSGVARLENRVYSGGMGKDRKSGKGGGERTNLEHLHGAVEEIHHLIARLVRIPVTARGQRVDACTVLVPLVLPESVRRAAVRQPVRVRCSPAARSGRRRLGSP